LENGIIHNLLMAVLIVLLKSNKSHVSCKLKLTIDSQAGITNRLRDASMNMNAISHNIF
jgi:hypothetical protein